MDRIVNLQAKFVNLKIYILRITRLIDSEFYPKTRLLLYERKFTIFSVESCVLLRNCLQFSMYFYNFHCRSRLQKSYSIVTSYFTIFFYRDIYDRVRIWLDVKRFTVNKNCKITCNN